MKTLALTKQLVDDNYTRRQVFRVLIGALVVLCLCYIYFIGTITFSIIARRTLESTLRDNASRVNSLEVEYLTLSNKVDAPLGLARGFVDSHKTIFATRTAGSAVAMR